MAIMMIALSYGLYRTLQTFLVPRRVQSWRPFYSYSSPRQNYCSQNRYLSNNANLARGRISLSNPGSFLFTIHHKDEVSRLYFFFKYNIRWLDHSYWLVLWFRVHLERMCQTWGCAFVQTTRRRMDWTDRCWGWRWPDSSLTWSLKTHFWLDRPCQGGMGPWRKNCSLLFWLGSKFWNSVGRLYHGNSFCSSVCHYGRYQLEPQRTSNFQSTQIKVRRCPGKLRIRMLSPHHGH